MTKTATIPVAEPPRTLLQTERAPSGLNALVTLRAPLGASADVTLAYVPDRAVLTRQSFARYVERRDGIDFVPEVLAGLIAEDIANEVVPKWQRVTVAVRADRITHTVTVEDRQPGWEHPSLVLAATVSPSVRD